MKVFASDLLYGMAELLMDVADKLVPIRSDYEYDGHNEYGEISK
jgi:hypothetical protein